MNIIELFSGTASFSKVANERGHKTFTIDFDRRFNPDLIKNVLDLDISDFPFKPDIIWASPPCECFSVASISKNWWKGYKPKTEKTHNAILIIAKTISLILSSNPEYWFIENPRAILRKISFMENLPKKTVTYCQYGEKYMKPTDIWTNFDWESKPPCKPRDRCHQSAPRGSRTGIQGLKTSEERAIVPRNLCLEIIKALENKL